MKPRRAPSSRAPRSAAPRGAPAAQPLALLRAALDRRAALLADRELTALRLIHAASDGLPGLVVERLGPVLVAQLHQGRIALDDSTARDICAAAAECVGAKAVYRKVFPSDRSSLRPDLAALHSDPQPWIGEAAPPRVEVLEHGLPFLVAPYDGYSTGLFLEHRANRELVRRGAAGRRVLNLFAYTCAFAWAALAGGAAQVVNVDISKRHLEWGRENLALAGLPIDPRGFVASDAADYLRRARRQGRGFDLVILDPPTFARARHTRATFSIESDLPPLVAAAVDRLAPGGLLLLCTNHRGTTPRRLEQTLGAAASAGDRRLTIVERPALPADFHGDPDYAKSVLARVE